MIRKNPSGDLPVVSESAFVDNTAILCGKVIVGDNVFIGPYAVIRADEVNEKGEMDPIVIGANSNIQDGVVIHSKAGGLVTIGVYTSIAHRSIVHGPCVVGDHVFIGFNSVLFNCVVGDRSVVRHNSVVEGCNVPPGFYIPSTVNIHSDADLARIERVKPDEASFSESVAEANRQLVKGYTRIRNEF
jgi:carbonic anhydrase/acetyltransferase-like protein (isoleucine patch superfamily)